MASLLRIALLGSAVLFGFACSSSGGDAAGTNPDGGAPEAGTPAPEAGTSAPVVTLGPPDFVDLGVVPADFELDVPAGVVGFSFQPFNGSGRTDVLQVTDPNGTTYLPADRPASLDPDLRWLQRFPASSRMLAVPSGTWKVKLAAPSTVRATWQRTSDGKFHGGTLDLWVHLPLGLHVSDFITGEAPADAVTTANAASNPVVKNIVDAFFTNMKRVVDLDRGTVTFVEADAKFLTIDSDEELVQATAVAGPLLKDEQFGLHVIFTELCKVPTQLGFGPYIAGIGFDRAFGTVVVKVKDQRPAGEDTQPYEDAGFTAGELSGGAMMHEAFHLWGLPHTSEAVDVYDDGFTDTVQCSKEGLAGDKTLCPDAKNIMAPFVLSPIGKSSLSPHQIAVIQGTSAYRPKVE